VAGQRERYEQNTCEDHEQSMRLAGPELSCHLTILKESGMIEGEYSGNWSIYSPTDEGRKYPE